MTSTSLHRAVRSSCRGRFVCTSAVWVRRHCGGNGPLAAGRYQRRLVVQLMMRPQWVLRAWPPSPRKRTALPLKQSPFAISTFSSSAERKRRKRRKKVRTIASQLICERAGAATATCSDRLEATRWTCSVDLCDALRAQTYKRADIVPTIRANPACNQSARSTHLPGCAIRATWQVPCENGPRREARPRGRAWSGATVWAAP